MGECKELGPLGIALSSSNITHKQFIWIIPMYRNPNLAHKQLTLIILSMVLRANKPWASSRFFLFFHQLVNGSRVDAGNRQTNNREALCKGGCHLSAFLRLSDAPTYIWIGLEGPSNKPSNFCLQNSIEQLSLHLQVTLELGEGPSLLSITTLLHLQTLCNNATSSIVLPGALIFF